MLTHSDGRPYDRRKASCATGEQNDITEQQDAPAESTEPENEQPAQQPAQAEIAEQQPDAAAESPDFQPTVESVVEAVLFASDESLSPARLADIAGTNIRQLRRHIDDLNEKYKSNNNAFRIEQIATGYQMLTLSAYSHWLKKLIKTRRGQQAQSAGPGDIGHHRIQAAHHPGGYRGNQGRRRGRDDSQPDV